jgi:hypothetical protein
MGAAQVTVPVTEMSEQRTPTRRNLDGTQYDGLGPNGHELVAITEWLPGREPTTYAPSVDDGPPYTHRTRFWRCRTCGQERTRPAEFSEPCDGDSQPHPLAIGKYSLEDSRTERALREDMQVRFGEHGSVYHVHSESDNTYEIDLSSWTCTCPDWTEREPAGGCKHLRRVDLEVQAGTTPQPDGTFRR